MESVVRMHQNRLVDLLTRRLLDPIPQVSDSKHLVGPENFISNMFPEDADAAGLWATLWEW